MKFNLGKYSVETDGDNFYIAETAIVLGRSSYVEMPVSGLELS